VARFVIPFCLGIAARGEIDPFSRFVVGQIEDGAPTDRVGLLRRLGVERGGAGLPQPQGLRRALGAVPARTTTERAAGVR
jgi:hypothetical protein